MPVILEQVEERLKFYDSGDAPRKNIAVMEKVAAEIAKEAENAEMATPSSHKKKKKKKRDKENERDGDAVVEAPSSKKKKKKSST